MSGKFFVAALLAASTASAATVGIVYTRVVSPRQAEAPAGAGNAQIVSGTVKSAIVLNAQEGSIERLPEAGDAPVCQSRTETAGCVMVSRASGIRLSILGYTVDIPPVWLGAETEDKSYGPDSRIPWLKAGQPLEMGIGRRRLPLGAADDRRESQPAAVAAEEAGNPSGPVAATSSSADLGAASGDGLALDRAIVVGEAPLFPPPDFAPAPESEVPPQPYLGADLPVSAPTLPLPSDPTPFGGGVPEPSTWLMMLAGFAALAALQRRWAVAALRSAACRQPGFDQDR